MKKDRLILGTIAGAVGGLTNLIFWGVPVKLIGLTDRSFYDYGMHLILFKPRHRTADYIVGVLAHLGISMTLGIVLAAVAYFTSCRYLILKGNLMGIFAWLQFLAIGSLFRMPLFSPLPAPAALTTFFGSLVWGTTAAYTLGILHRRYVTNAEKHEIRFRRFWGIPSPASKPKMKDP